MTVQSNVRQLDYAIPIPDKMDKYWLFKTYEGRICLISMSPMITVWLVFFLIILETEYRQYNFGPQLHHLENICVYFNLLYWPAFFLLHVWPFKNPFHTIVYSRIAGRILTELIICNMLLSNSFRKDWAFRDPFFLNNMWIAIGIFCWFIIRQYFPTLPRMKYTLIIYLAWIALFGVWIHICPHQRIIEVCGVEAHVNGNPCNNGLRYMPWWWKMFVGH